MESHYPQPDSDRDRLLDPTEVDGSINVSIVKESPLVDIDAGSHEAVHKTYKSRWYILAVFALLNVVQCVGWNTWGPIADTSKLVLNWSDGDIALLTNWGPITYIMSGLFFSWVLDTRGLRVSVVSSAIFLLLGFAMRCLPVGISNTKWTVNVGQILIGISSPVFNGAPTLISVVWFPPHQRTTATAISATAIYLGFAMSFLIGPQIVTDITVTNGSSIDPAVNQSSDWSDAGLSLDPSVRAHHFHEIMLLMYIECGAGAVLALCTLFYFPDKPPSPPSFSAATTRESFKQGTLHLAKNPQFWLVSLAYCISTGVYSAWVTQLDSIFEHADGVDQDTVGWIGFYANIAGSLGGLLFARVVDRLGGNMKRVLLVLVSLASVSCLWCLLLSMKFIPFNMAQLYISCVSLGFFTSSTVPIYYEITVEGVYPVAEGVTTMVLTLMNNGCGLLFLLLPLIPDIGVVWMTWVELAAASLAVPLLLLYRESYNRMKQDKDDALNASILVQGTSSIPIS